MVHLQHFVVVGALLATLSSVAQADAASDAAANLAAARAAVQSAQAALNAALSAEDVAFSAYQAAQATPAAATVAGCSGPGYSLCDVPNGRDGQGGIFPFTVDFIMRCIAMGGTLARNYSTGTVDCTTILPPLPPNPNPIL